MKDIRNIAISKPVALLATGDEIIQGDILNTNCQQIALRLMDHHISAGMHVTSGDNTDDIERAMDFLLKTHQALIITGGLGPTSDDLTRFALSKLIKQPLIFDESTWDNICQRLKRFGYPTPPESNRQQALFPADATIIPNPNGTAAGCWVKFKEQYIFMLPGPPDECLPMIDSVVIPVLSSNGYQQQIYREKWMLFGASEGKIAEQLDQFVNPYHCITGYRICYPYLEFKILTQHQETFNILVPLIENTIKPYLIGNGKQTASQQVIPLLENLNYKLGICDLATGGLLETTIKTPAASHLFFSKQVSDLKNIPYLSITGLEEYWQKKNDVFHTALRLEFHSQNNTQQIETIIPWRGERVKLYAVEWICQQMIKFI